jgi:hypothetical protein
LTSLQFRYDGYKRSERRPGVCFFPPRYNFYNYGADIPDQEKVEEKKVVEGENDFLELPEQVEVEKETEKEAEKETEKKEAKGNGCPTAQISEILLKNLTTTEERLHEVKGQVEFAKTFFDDLIYKLESFLQIVEIVQANEKRRLREPQAQLASLKTSQDSVDEVLELLQGPVFQNILRQFLINVLVRESDVTKFQTET